MVTPSILVIGALLFVSDEAQLLLMLVQTFPVVVARPVDSVVAKQVGD